MNLHRLTLVSLLAAGGTLCAQDSVGVLVGTVRDKAGRPLPGASLVLSGDKLLGQRRLVTDDKGAYRIPHLMPGRYQVRADKRDFVSTKADLILVAGQAFRQDLVLRPVEVAATVVEVIADAALVDKSSTSTATTLGSQQLSTLPVSLADGAGAAVLAPGVFSQGDSSNSIRGGDPSNVDATLDGISVREPARGSTNLSNFTLTDLVENFAVVQSPTNAKYGNSASGAFVAVTKTGGNAFSGTLRVNLDRGDGRGSWGALSFPTFNRFRQTLSDGYSPFTYTAPRTFSDDIQRTYEVSLTGPIVKDKLSFTFGTRIKPTLGMQYSAPSLLGSQSKSKWYSYLPGFTGPNGEAELAGHLWGENPADPTAGRLNPGGNTRESFHQGRLLWQINADHQVDLSMTQWAVKDTWRYATMLPEESNPVREVKMNTTALSYRGTLSADSLIEVKIGRMSKEETSATGKGDPINFKGFTARANLEDFFDPMNAMGDAGSGFLANGTMGTTLPARNVSDTALVSYKLIKGGHDLDLGLEYRSEGFDMTNAKGIHGRAFFSQGRHHSGKWLAYNYWDSPVAQDPTLNYYFLASGMATEMQTWSNSGSGETMGRCTTTSFFANDLVELSPRFSVNLGLRYEHWKVKDVLGTRVSSAALSPRVSLRFDPFQDSSRLVTLNLGVYRGSFSPSRLGSFLAMGGTATRRYLWNQGAATPYLVDQAQLLNPANYKLYSYLDQNLTSTYDKEMQPDRTREVELAFRRGFTNGASLRLSLVYRRIDNLMGRSVVDQKVEMTDPNLPPGSPVFTFIRQHMGVDPVAYYDHRAVELEWQQPILQAGAHRLDLGGNWVYARSLGRDGAWGSFYEKLPELGIPLDLYAPYGMRQPEHMGKAWLTYTHSLADGTRSTLSLLGTYNTGEPIPHPLAFMLPEDTYDPAILYRPQGAYLYPHRPGSRTSMDNYTVDLRWNLDIPLRKGLTFFTDLSITNVLNLDNNSTFLAPLDSDYNPRYWNRPGAGPNDLEYRLDPMSYSLANLGVINAGRGRSYRFSTGLRF